jgi:parallel beta-helix repeat protein
MVGSSYNAIEGNEIFNLPGVGIRIYWTGESSCVHNSLTGNTISGSNIWQGIFVDHASYSLIANNEIVGNLHEGIRLAASSQCSVVENIITDGGKSINNTISAIYLESNSTYNSIKSNIVSSSGSIMFKYGYSEASPRDDYNVVLDNSFLGMGTSGLQKCGVNTLVKNNRGFVTENNVTVNNSTATTFVFNHGLAGKATGCWCSFDTPQIVGYTWVSSATQVTVTVIGSDLPSTTTCYANVVYNP